MAPKGADKLSLRLPAWMEEIPGLALRHATLEAMVVRRVALGVGALSRKKTRPFLTTGDRALHAIAAGRVEGRAARVAVARALGSYTRAMDEAGAT